jgi:hypothetical protein
MIIPLTNKIPPKMAITIAAYGVYDIIFDLKCISLHIWDNTLDTAEILHAT